MIILKPEKYFGNKTQRQAGAELGQAQDNLKVDVGVEVEDEVNHY